jgi:hypothetical protein
MIKTHMGHIGAAGATLAAERAWLLGIPEAGTLEGIQMQGRSCMRLDCRLRSAADLDMAIQGVWVRGKGSHIRQVRSSRTC